ncbi:DUF234 domain-containing protein [Nocardioides sp. 31GB23]|uniref:ATP-binding protein n=1 Tax=Nocardioides sp. 31GB23 TaxID=3156065 RepID=UPI0032AECFCD
MAFIGRDEHLRRLDQLLTRAREEGAKPGRAVLIRGRRRVGKSSLVEVFVERVDVPHLFFAATGRPVKDELRLFAQEAADSNLPGADLFNDVQLESWDAALRLLNSAVGDAGSIVVFDEMPYLIAADPDFEGTLQRAFDRDLSRRKCLLIGIGSDIAVMEALNTYGRPFYQRATEIVVPPLTPAEVGAMLNLDAADAFDAYLVTGGLPLICDEWPPGLSLWEYLEEALSHPTSALLVSAERSLAAEFPQDVQARLVLGTIGSGERTFTKIAQRSGDLQPGSLNRALKLLVEKRVVAVDQPLSTKTSAKDKRYRIDDTYLRFWLEFLGPYLPEIERGRGDRVLVRIRRSWTSWRGRAIEPVLHEALDRLGPDVSHTTDGVPGVVGSYWTRTNDPEIDIVVADRQAPAKTVVAVGSIKWLETAAFDSHDLAALLVHRTQLPGADPDTPLIVISRSGCKVDGVTHLGPDDLIAAYRTQIPAPAEPAPTTE